MWKQWIQKYIYSFPFLLFIYSILVFILLGSNLKLYRSNDWGFNSLIIGETLIFLSMSNVFLKIFLTNKFKLYNPGGKELQIICIIFAIAGTLLIIFSCFKFVIKM